MTKAVDITDIASVMTRYLECLRLTGVREITGKSQSWVYQVGDPDNTLTFTDIEMLVGLDKACMAAGFPPPYHTYHAIRLGLGTHTAQELNGLMLELGEHVGKLLGTHREAIEPDGPGGKDYSKCEERAAKEVLQKIIELCLESIEAITQAANPTMVSVAAGDSQ